MTKRKTSFEKFWTRYERAVVNALVSDELTPEQLRRLDDLHYRHLHWESHEAELDNCPWCRKYPPLSH